MLVIVGTVLLSLALHPILNFAEQTVWDFAPDFSKDTIPPYPPLTNPDGTDITIQNLRGTRLFGWRGCDISESNAIAEAFDDFHKLVSLPEVYNSISWNDRAAIDFFGAASGKNRIPDKRRKEIQRELSYFTI